MADRSPESRLVVGAEVGVEGAQDEMVALAEKLSVPVTETLHSLYANIPNYHPLFLGELMAERYPRKQDLLISFGESFTTTQQIHYGTSPWSTLVTTPIPWEGRCVRTWPFSRRFAPRSATFPMHGWDVDQGSDGQNSRHQIGGSVRVHRQLKQSREMALRARFEDTPLTWERVGYELEKALDKDAVIVPEVGTEHDKIFRQLTLGGPNKQKIGRTKGDALGWGVRAAFGVNVALPEKQVVALQGDGGFCLASQRPCGASLATKRLCSS